jgi:hypothetical protein
MTTQSMPTMTLRFVTREVITPKDLGGHELPDGFVRTFSAQFLQQLFCDVNGDAQEWRDVPGQHPDVEAKE